MVANNWDRESAQLFSRIQRQRKADKLNQYMGGNMGMASDPSWKKEEGFSEELKQIVRETKGQWKESAKGIVYSKNDPSGKVGMKWVYSAEGLDHAFWCCEDNIEHEVVLRPEFEACLMEMTGRPNVKDWPGWIASISQSITGSWFAMESSGARYKLPFYGEFINGENVSKKEALERERIINGASSSEVELKYLDETNKEVGLKICNQSCRELGAGCGCDIAVESDDWFRNGGLPPVGVMVKVSLGEATVKAHGIAAGRRCIFVQGENWTETTTNFVPVDFDISEIHAKALRHNKTKEVMAIFCAVYGSDADWAEDRLKQEEAFILYDKGCRIHPELAE